MLSFIHMIDSTLGVDAEFYDRHKLHGVGAGYDEMMNKAKETGRILGMTFQICRFIHISFKYHMISYHHNNHNIHSHVITC